MNELFDNQRNPKSTETLCPAPTIVAIDAAVTQHLSQVYWEWRAAFDRDPQASPLQHPDYVLAELGTTRTASGLQAVLLRDESDRNDHALAILVPKSVRTRQVGGVWPGWTLKGLRLAGGRFLGSGASEERQQRLLTATLRHATRAGADFVLIEDLEAATSLHALVHQQSQHGCQVFATHDFQPRHFIDFPETADQYWSAFSSRSLSKFRRNLKKLGTTRLDRIETIGQLPDFLKSAHEISRQSWQSRQFGLRVHNDDAELQRLSALAQHGLLRSYLWSVNDKPAAFAICNQNGDCFRYEEIAYAAEFSQFSPGRTMLHQIVEDLLRHDSPRRLDFGGGDAEYKQQFANRTSQSGTIWLVPATSRAAWSLAYLKACRALRGAVRRLIEKSGWHTRARQWIRSTCVSAAPEVVQDSGEAVTPSPTDRCRELPRQFTAEGLP